MRFFHTITGIGLLCVLSCSGISIAGTLEERATIIPASSEEVLHQGAVFTFLQEYFSALAKGEVEKLAVYHPALSPEQLDILRDYFASTISDLHIHLNRVRVQVAAHTATVAFYRTDDFIDRPTGRPVEKSIELSTKLVQDASGWRLAGFDQIAFALVSSKTRMS